MIYYYDGVERLRLLFDSPNKLAALVCMLIPLVACLTCRCPLRNWRWRMVFVVFSVICIALECILVLTYSRGGFVAFGASVSVLVWCGFRRSSAWLCGAFGMLMLLVPKAVERAAQISPMSDLSIWHRLLLWKGACGISVNAFPFGVERDVGPVFVAWYQALNKHQHYLTAVSDPLTIAARYGLPVLFALMLVASTILFASADFARRRQLAFPAALPLVELYGPMREVFRDNPDRWFNGDRIHPDFAGHMLMASLVWSAMGEPGEFSRVALDARGASSLAATYRPQGLPCAVDADYRKLAAVYPLAARLNTETLAVAGLADGLYELKADGWALGRFTASELAAGVNLAERETPNQVLSRRTLDAVRRLVRLEQDRRVFGSVCAWLREAGVDLSDAAAVAAWVRDERPKSASLSWGGWRNHMLDTFEALYPGRDALAARADALHAEIAAVRPVAWSLTLQAVQLSLVGDGRSR